MTTVKLRIGDETRSVSLLSDGADHAVADGSCPKCGVERFRIQGANNHIASHDTYEADGYCTSCHEHVGTIVAKVDTLFGIEEDERVLRGRYRVY